MKQIFPLWLCLLLLPFAVKAQSARSHINTYPDYIPYQQEHMPVKRVRLVVHSIAKADGSGNFTDSATHRQFIQQLIWHCEWYFSELEPFRTVNGPVDVTFIPDSRVRFVLDTAFFHHEDDDWDYYLHSSKIDTVKGDTNYVVWTAYREMERLHQKYVAENPALNVRQRDSSLHVFLLEAQGHHKGKGIAHNISSKKWVSQIGAWEGYKEGRNHWGPGALLAHEIGHALGLQHPFEYNPCKDVPRLTKGQTNSIMDYWPLQGRGLTPCQTGVLHWSLSGGTGDIHDAVIKDWAYHHPDSVMYIRTGDSIVWGRPQWLWGDLIVENEAVLVINKPLTMPPAGRIRVRTGGKLVINDLITTMGDRWEGIIRHKRRGFFLLRKRPEGLVEFGENGRLERAKKDPEEEMVKEE